MSATYVHDGLGALSQESAKAYRAIFSSRGIDITGMTVMQIRQAARDWATGKTDAQQKALLLDLCLAPLIRD